MSHSFIQTCCCFHVIKDERFLSKVEKVKTNFFSDRLAGTEIVEYLEIIDV